VLKPRSSALEAAGRAGFVARGVIYGLVGVLALQVLGAGDARADQQGALKVVARQPFGGVLVGALAAGFAGYAAWRVVEAVRRDDDGATAWLERAGYLVSAAAYAALAVGSVSLLTGDAGPGRDQASTASATVLSWPGGPWLVGTAGLALAGVGVWMAWRGLSRDFADGLELGSLSEGGRRAVELLGVVGNVARGVVFGVMGWFVVRAAVRFDPDQAAGFDVALHRVANASYGPFLLAAVATGLLVFAAFCFAQARYRRIE
jgi:hypothetical protein